LVTALHSENREFAFSISEEYLVGALIFEIAYICSSILIFKQMLVKKHNQKIVTAIAIVCVFVFGFFVAQDVLAQVDTGLQEVGEATGLGSTDPRIIAGRIIQYFLGFLGVIALILILYGGFIYMTSGGEEEKVGKAKKYIINAIIGLVIILSAFAITSYVMSSLLDATGADGSVVDGGGGGGLTIFGQKKLTAKIIPSGDLPTYNFAIKVKFNYPLTTQSIGNIENYIKVEQINDDGSIGEISGDIAMLDNNKVVNFMSDDGCPSECDSDYCFAKNKQFRVSLLPNVIISTETDNDGYNLVRTCTGLGACEEEFHTGDKCDTRPPNVTIQSPGYNNSICQGYEMEVAISGRDNLGLGMQFYELDPGTINSLDDIDPYDSEVIANAPLEYTSYFVWPDSGTATVGTHYIGGGAIDLSDNFKFTTKRINVVPADCCNEDGEIDCEGENTNCPSCSGGCSDDFDCASGICYEGECQSWPTINNIYPSQGAPGNFIQITGDKFENYDSENSKVYFSCTGTDCGEDGYVEATLGCDPKFSWDRGQVIAQVPQNAITGPIKIVNKLGQFDDTLNDRGWQGNFIMDPGLENPGLCSVFESTCDPTDPEVNCSIGSPGQSVVVSGTGFGGSKGASDNVYFGEYAGTLSGTWTNTLISGMKIPNLATGYVNVVVGKGERCLTEICESTVSCQEGEPDCVNALKTKPCYDSRGLETCYCYFGDVCTEGEDHCECRDLYSNPYRFKIDRPTNLPEITDISPDSAPANQLITVKGSNFGNSVGRVEFVDGENVITSDLGCSSEFSWNDVQITAIVPEKLRQQSDTASVFVRVITADNLQSNQYSYTINSSAPAPGICALRPDNGPEGTPVNIIGQGFGEDGDFSIMFYNQAEADEFIDDYTWSDELISAIRVPGGAVSGAVRLEGTAIQSNAINFNVGSCSATSCNENEVCCQNGVCMPDEPGCEGEYEYKDSEFAWVVSTGPLPRIPKVLERTCDSEFGLSASAQPMHGTRNACVNGEIGATFNMIMDWNSFNVDDAGQKVVIKRCIEQPADGEVLASCDLDLCCEENNSRDECKNEDDSYLENCVKVGIDSKTELDQLTSNLNIVCEKDGQVCARGTEGCICNPGDVVGMFTVDLNLDKFKPSIIDNSVTQNLLFANSWYQVEILGGPGGVAETEGYFMPQTYKWKFKTGTEPCVPSELMITPGKGLIEGVDEKEVYKVYGLFECQMIEMADFNGSWRLTDFDENRAEFYGNMCSVNNQLEPCTTETAGARKDYGVFWINRNAIDPATGLINQYLSYNIETSANDFVQITASGLVDSLLLSDNSLLEIKFVEPKVVNYYPDCLGACINAALGAEFNTKMNHTSFANAVEVWQCETGDCLAFDGSNRVGSYDYVYSLDQNNNTINRLTVNLVNNQNLIPNKFYRVILRDTIKSSSGKGLTNLNYSEAGAPDFDCANLTDDDEDNTVDYTGGYDKEAKGESGYGTLDFVCGCYLESSNEFSSYSKNPTAKTCISPAYFACRDLNETINDPMIKSEELLAEQVFKYNYLAPDSLCESAESWEQGFDAELDSFSWVFKTKDDDTECKLDRVQVDPLEFIATEAGQKIQYAATPYSTPDECSAQGQALNPLQYDWEWASSQTDIATIDQTNYNPDLPEYCAANCLTTGSNRLGAVCGNSEIEAALGEECDDGNIIDNDGCSSVCLFEPFTNCTDPENNLNCCGNGSKDVDEECDQGCDWQYDDGEVCTPSADDAKCVCRARGTVCTAGCLNAGSGRGFACGNGSVDPGEDRDSGAQLSSNCLNLGAQYQINADSTSPAVCGNGTVETGEECEPIANDPYCTDKCVWRGFNRCNTSDKVCRDFPHVSCTEDFYSDFDIDGVRDGVKDFCLCMDFEYQHLDLYPCCGDGIESDYNGDGVLDEECEAICTIGGAMDGDVCSFGSENCECNMPAGCSTTCIHEGSSFAYDSFCGDGTLGAGEDDSCDGPGKAGTFVSPYQIATINSDIFSALTPANVCSGADCLFNFDLITLLTQGTTGITAQTADAGQAKVSGSADLTFQTEQCTYPEILLSNSQPADSESDVCRNALINVAFDSKVQAASLSRENVKLYKKLNADENCCGNGTIEGTETCDDGNTYDEDGCSSVCEIEPGCGNNVLEAGEDCDDGNTEDGDGCSNTCQIEPGCGNGIVEEGEECDDGNKINGDGCGSRCQLESVCGDGVVEEAEECDDGNEVDDDNCHNNCTITKIIEWNFNEGSGNKTADDTGNGNDLEFNEGDATSWAADRTDKPNHAIQFSQLQESYASILDSDINPSAGWTISMWVYPEKIDQTKRTIFQLSNEDIKDSVSFAFDQDNIYWVAVDANNYVSEASFNVSLENKEWQQITFVCNKEENEDQYSLYIYINGNFERKESWSFDDILISAFNDFTLAKSISIGYDKFIGAMDQISIYNQSLSSDQIGLLYDRKLSFNAKQNLHEYGFVGKIYNTIKTALNKVKIFARNALVNVGWAQEDVVWCEVGIVYDLVENQLNNSEILLTPVELMEPLHEYKLEFTNLRNVCNAQSTATVNFTTREEICRITNVAIDPADVFLTRSNEFTAEPYTATAMYHDQPIFSILDVYDWDWEWEVLDSSIAGIASIDPDGNSDDPQNVTVNSYNKNGKTLIKAELTVTVDTEEGQAGLRRAGYGNLEVFLCENLWGLESADLIPDFSMWGANANYPTHLWHSSGSPSTNIGLFYCRDAGENPETTCDNGQPCHTHGDCAGIGNQVCSAPSVCQDGISQCSANSECIGIGNGKCLEKGMHDDLPKLKVIAGTSATSDSNQCTDSLDNDSDNRADGDLVGVRTDQDDLIYPKDPKCVNVNDLWEMPKLLAQYFFTRDPADDLDDDSSDIISLRVYENPEAISPELWYMRYAPNPGNLVSADFDCLSDDQGEYCYHGGREGSTVYISAANFSDPLLYNNIYILGYNEGANIATQNIFNQLLETMKFNLNITDDTAVYDKKLAFRKDLERVQHVALIRKFIDIYQTLNNGRVPQLESGTYVRGESFSVWPSWQDELGRTLGVSLPVDPENHFEWVAAVSGGEGEVCGEAVVGDDLVPLKCPQTTQQCIMPNYYCSTCPPGWDKETCYSSSVADSNIPNFANSYTTPVDHPLYHYQAEGERDYKLDFHLEGVLKEYYTNISSVSNVPKRCIHNGVACSTDADCGTGGTCAYTYQ